MCLFAGGFENFDPLLFFGSETWLIGLLVSFINVSALSSIKCSLSPRVCPVLDRLLSSVSSSYVG